METQLDKSIETDKQTKNRAPEKQTFSLPSSFPT